MKKRTHSTAGWIAPISAPAEETITVGGLAEIAHAINNSLAGMVQNAQVVQGRLETNLGANRKAAERNGTSVEAVQAYLKDRKILQMLDAIRTSGAQAADLVAQMIRLTDGHMTETDRHDLHKLAAENTENQDHGH